MVESRLDIRIEKGNYTSSTRLPLQRLFNFLFSSEVIRGNCIKRTFKLDIRIRFFNYIFL